MLKRFHLLDYVGLFFCGLLAGVLSGGLMNVFNGWLSPGYFGMVFYYPGGSTSWTEQELYWHSIWQGLVEGLFFGSIMGTVFAVYVCVASRASCRFTFAAPYILKMSGVAFLFWLLGGLSGILVGLMFPQFMDLTVIGVSQPDRLKYLWVGASIYGVYFGTLVSLVMGCVWFSRGWMRSQGQR